MSRSLTLCLTTFVFYCSLFLRYHSVKLPLSLHGRQNIHQMPRTRRVMPGLNLKSSSYCHDVTHTLALVHMTIVTGVLRCRRVLTFPLFCEFLYRPGCTPVHTIGPAPLSCAATDSRLRCHQPGWPAPGASSSKEVLICFETEGRAERRSEYEDCEFLN